MEKVYKTVRALLFIGSAFFFNFSFAQTYELGIFSGLNLYKGEISPNINPINIGLNGQIVGRYNIDHQSTIRGNLSHSYYSASDKNNRNNLSKVRNSQIRGTIGEASFIYEHNFFSYREEKSHLIISPYVLGGLGIIGFSVQGGRETSQGSFFNPVIPFGVGTKIILTKNLNLNIEFATRKTFTDFLDNTHDEVNNRQNGYNQTFDWYSFFSAGITYTFYPIICPVNN